MDIGKKRKYIRISEEELKKIVQKSISHLLMEASGISDEVVEASKQVLSELFKVDFKTLNWEKAYINDETLIWPYKTIRTFVKIPNPITINGFDSVKTFQFTLYNFLTMEDISEYGIACGIGGGFNLMDKEISITIPCLDMIPLRGNAYELLAHELMHVFQDEKKGGEDVSFAYAKAMSILNQKVQYNEKEWVIANLIYRLDRREIDANAQELFLQLLGRSDQPLKVSSFEGLMEFPFMREAEYVKRNFAMPFLSESEEYEDILQEFHLKLSDFISFVKRGVSYSDRKLRQVVNRYLTVSNQGKIKVKK